MTLLKVYKEYDDSAWNLWRSHARDKGVRTLQEWVHGDPEAIKATLKEAQAKHKEVCMCVRLRAFACSYDCVCICVSVCVCYHRLSCSL